MMRKSVWAMLVAVALVVAGTAYAGPHDHGKHAEEKGHNCMLGKNVSKTATMTDDGAVVVLEGKSAEAVQHIQSHLESHQKGGDCPDCPFSMENVTAKVKMTDKGGEITLTGSTPEA